MGFSRGRLQRGQRQAPCLRSGQRKVTQPQAEPTVDRERPGWRGGDVKSPGVGACTSPRPQDGIGVGLRWPDSSSVSGSAADMDQPVHPGLRGRVSDGARGVLFSVVPSSIRPGGTGGLGKKRCPWQHHDRKNRYPLMSRVERQTCSKPGYSLHDNEYTTFRSYELL